MSDELRSCSSAAQRSGVIAHVGDFTPYSMLAERHRCGEHQLSPRRDPTGGAMVTLLITLVLLMLAFRSWAQTALIMLSAPFALVGGVLLQWFQGYAITTAVIIGYVAVLAIAVQTGIIMVEFIRDSLARRTAERPYVDAVIEGSVARLRPKLMTVATTVLGLIPIMLASGSGFDVTQPIAAPSVGGMISSTIYVLFLIPCLFAIGHDLRARFGRR